MPLPASLLRRPRRLMHPRTRRLLLAGAAATVAIAGCGTRGTSGASTASGTASGSSAGISSGGMVVPVVAAENFWGDITSQIGGSHVKVTSIITDPNADPHSYETDPRDAAAISSATFVVLNGAGYDEFASKLLAASPNPARTVLSVDKLVGLSGANPNPHLWYDPGYVNTAAHAIETQLATTDPADAASFEAGLRTFQASYQPYVDTLAAIRARYAAAPVGYTERVPGYLISIAGLSLATPASFAQAVEDGNDPSPADTAALADALEHKKVKVLLYNSQVTSPTTAKVRQQAAAAGVPVVGVAETIPAGEHDFQSWQTDQAKAVLAALGG